MGRRKRTIQAEQTEGDENSTEECEPMDTSEPKPNDENSDEEDLLQEIRNTVDEENLLDMEIPPMPEPVMASDGTGQRLIIESIEVENFKSYYGKTLIGPFHHNFTSVIGPNGSGKSNVIDSLLFVFGYRASKIRSKKISVLIHCSAGRENIKSCTVTVNFQKIIDTADGKYEVVQGSEFKVSRTAYKDNTSKYTLNGKTTQFRDIAKHLRQSGIDLVHNRFLILQGEVEQIALMKPKALSENDDGMLEYLEDIIGSSRLKLPIEKLQQKIEALREERSLQLERVKHVEKQKVEAEGPMMDLVAEMRCDNAIALHKNRLLQMEKHKISENLQLEEDKRKNHNEEYEKLRARLQEISNLLSTKNEEQKSLRKEFEKAQKLCEKRKNDKEEVHQAHSQRKIHLLRLRDKEKKLQSDAQKEERKIKDFESAPERSKAKIAEFEGILNGIDDVIASKRKEVDRRIEDFQEETDDFQTNKKSLEEELAKFVVNEDETGSKLTLAQEEYLILQNDHRKEQEKLCELKASSNEAKQLHKNKERDLKTVRNVLPSVESELQSLREQLESKKAEEAKCAENVRRYAEKFEQTNQAYEACRSQNNALKKLMAEKVSGSIPGIFGRLGDLGAIDVKYDVAISTTCGALDYIVVDTVDTAQKCVELLKREHLGIASFLVLDIQEKFRPMMEKLASTPENVPRLFDLIQVKDPAVLPAFYFALRDTLVADDITAATRIGVGGAKRYRVVTLKGELVEISGVMTGGGVSVRRGRIGQNVKVDTTKESLRETADLRNLLERERKRLNTLREEIQKDISRADTLKVDLDHLKRNERNLCSEIESLEAKFSMTDKLIKEQNTRVQNVAVDESTIEMHKAKITELDTAHNEAVQAADCVRERLSKVELKIQLVYDKVVGQYQKELDEAVERKETASKGITKERSALNNVQRNIHKAKARMNDLENDLKVTVESLKQLELDEEQYQDNVDALEKEILQANIAMKDAEIKLKEWSGRNTELDSEEVDLKKTCAELTRTREKIESVIQTLRTKVDAIDSKISGLHLKFIKCLNRLPDNVRVEDDDISLNEALSYEKKFFSDLKEETINADEEELVVKVGKLPVYTPEEITTFDKQEIDFHLLNLEKTKSKKQANANVLRDYVKKLSRYDRETNRLAEISQKRDKHRQLYEKLRKQRLGEFMDGLIKIGVALKEMYQMVTYGGDASLDLVNSLDPFSEGVSFGVRPPKKSWKQITNLSGGEKTLASLALVFALHHYRPTPLYVMDEIDAALDFRNVSIIGHYLKDRTKNAQFIVISLRNNMFELANRLIGIFKISDCTRNIAIDVGELNSAEPDGNKNDLTEQKNKTNDRKRHSVQRERKERCGGSDDGYQSPPSKMPSRHGTNSPNHNGSPDLFS